MNKQVTDTILMVRPVDFHFNHETAKNNYYQKNDVDSSEMTINELATKEFDSFVDTLRSKGINVIVVDDLADPVTPDSIFPNNWVSFHEDGSVGLYPMFAENRRLERRSDIIETLRDEGFKVSQIKDLTEAEMDGEYLEGTGSMVLDRENKIAYAAISVRTSKEVLKDFCKGFGYEAVDFVAYQTANNQRLPIYHTNVMMCVADQFAILCANAISDMVERDKVIDRLEITGKELVYISERQKYNFAGNMLQLANADGDKFTVMSSAAYESLSEDQIEIIKKYGGIIHSSLSTIERLGGGSARCMMAEVFLPRN